jgi:hypothetical protein
VVGFNFWTWQGKRSSSIYGLTLQCASHLGKLSHNTRDVACMVLASKRYSGGSVGNWLSPKSLPQITAREMVIYSHLFY